MNIIIEKIAECLAEPEKIRFVASIDEDISEILPYLNRILPNAIYNHEGKTLTFIRQGRIITIHPNKIAGGKIIDEKDAYEIIKWINEKIEYCYKNKEKIEPDYKRKDSLKPLDIYKYLPGTNCRKCGENSCLAFAVKISNEEENIIKCSEIFLPEYEEKRKMLFEILKNSGYKTPPF